MAVLLVAGCKTPSGDQSAVKASSGHAAAANGGAASAYTGPEVPASFQGEDARTEWLKYCIGGEDVADKPKPNYANAEVKAAVKKLNLVFDHSFAIHQFSYKAILDKFSTPLEAESFEVKPNTHDYLNYLCGEFRDRPTMIAAKLRWMARMNFVDKKKAGETFDVLRSRHCSAGAPPVGTPAQTLG